LFGAKTAQPIDLSSRFKAIVKDRLDAMKDRKMAVKAFDLLSELADLERAVVQAISMQTEYGTFCAPDAIDEALKRIPNITASICVAIGVPPPKLNRLEVQA
jgi:hypothetical protein